MIVALWNWVWGEQAQAPPKALCMTWLPVARRSTSAARQMRSTAATHHRRSTEAAIQSRSTVATGLRRTVVATPVCDC
jgi:hypothetical protein